MYSTCTFCHASLGKNEALERFPVGARLAFDQAQGRLWVVCPSCRQWNLSPLEERWEAIEEGEKLYRDAKQRVATDHIGMAKLRDGTELIRIGEPLRPEFAAWRYGERFTTRWRKAALWGTVGVVTMGGIALAGPLAGISFGGLVTAPMNLYRIYKTGIDDRTVLARHEDADGPFMLTRTHARTTRLIADRESALGWGIEAKARPGSPNERGLAPSQTVIGARNSTDRVRAIRGPAALEALRAILPEVNSSGGRAATVQDAVRLLEAKGGPERMFTQGVKWSGRGDVFERSWELHEMNVEIRLALEMAAHEETERQAMQGELAALEAVWRDAEEIAAIADSLTLPERITKRLERLVEGR
jgi:hypothetical protein